VEKDTWRIFSKKLADLVPEIPKNLNSAKEKLGVLFLEKLDLILETSMVELTLKVNTRT